MLIRNARRHTVPVVVLLISAVVVSSLPLAAQTQPPTPFSDYLQGKSDGERDGKGSAWWVLTGCSGGCGGILTAWLLPVYTGLPLWVGIPLGLAEMIAAITTPLMRLPSPSGLAVIGRSSEYAKGYTEGFQQRTLIANMGWSAAGCLVGAAAGGGCVIALQSLTY